MILAVIGLLANSLLGELGDAAPAPESVAAPAPAPAVAPAPEAAPAAAETVVVARPAEKAKTEKAKAGKAGAEPRSVRISSERTDFDRKEGVIMFDRNVFVDDAEYKMRADQLYVFLDPEKIDAKGLDREKPAKGESREDADMLRRIVALGNVSITNDTRVGSCAKAVYTKATSKIVMYGDPDKGVNAVLTDNGKRRSQVEGRRITFWIDTEQVEVEGSTVTLDAGGFGGKEGARKLLGK